MQEMLPEATEVYRHHLGEKSLPAARDMMVGFQVFKPKATHDLKHMTPLDAEIERRGLAGRSLEELRYFVARGYMPEEEERFGGEPLMEPFGPS
jgi:hypothetical protein